MTGQALDRHERRRVAGRSDGRASRLLQRSLGAEPELPARTHGRGGLNRLTLPGPINDGDLATQSHALAIAENRRIESGTSASITSCNGVWVQQWEH